MTPLYRDPHFSYRFADDRIIPRFHLEGVPAGNQVFVFKIDAATGERLGLLATCIVGEGGWVDLAERWVVDYVESTSPLRRLHRVRRIGLGPLHVPGWTVDRRNVLPASRSHACTCVR